MVMLTLFFAPACEDYAKVEDLQKVDRKVGRVEQKQVSDTLRFSSSVSAVSHRIEWVETRQSNQEVVLEQMGDGFNILSESVQETHEEQQQIRYRQDRLEATVERRFAPVVGQQPAVDTGPVVLRASGLDIRNERDTGVLELVLDDPPVLRGSLTADDPSVVYEVEEIGSRMFAIADDPDASLCLDIVERNEYDVAFVATPCNDPFNVFEFVLLSQ